MTETDEVGEVAVRRLCAAYFMCVMVSRALRKWRDQHPGEPPPVDRVIFLTEPHGNRSKGQIAMAKGVATVHAEIQQWLRDAGVRTDIP